MWLGYLLIALIPVVGIIYLILQKDHMNEDHKRLLFKTIFWGMFSVPLVFAVHYLLKKYAHIDLEIFVSQQASELYDFKGDLAYIARNFFKGGLVMTLFLGLLSMAVIEEYAKHWIVKRVDWNEKSFNRIIDGVEYSIAAALGFSLVENIIYFSMIQDAFLDIYQILPAIVIRAILTTIAHVLFSGIFGYYYGRAKFVGHTRKMYENHVRRLHHFHVLKGLKVRFLRIKYLLQGKNLHDVYRDHFHEDELIAEGLIVATVLHSLFNLTLSLSIGYLVVPLLAIEYFIIAHEFHIHSNFIEHEGL